MTFCDERKMALCWNADLYYLCNVIGMLLFVVVSVCWWSEPSIPPATDQTVSIDIRNKNKNKKKKNPGCFFFYYFEAPDCYVENLFVNLYR